MTIFNKKNILKKLSKMRKWDWEILETPLREAWCCLEYNKPRYIFEGGFGNGRFTIPFLRNIPCSWRYWGVDISQSSLEAFESRIKQDNVNLGDKIHLIATGWGDITRSLPFHKEWFTDWILSLVLQCIPDEPEKNKGLYNSLTRTLKRGGLLWLLLRTDSFTRVISGDFSSRFEDVNLSFVEFWKTYYALRNEMGLPSLLQIKSLYDVDRVKERLAFEQCFQPRFNKVVEFPIIFSFSEFLEFIHHGAYTSLGEGITFRQRMVLKEKMQNWLNQNKIPLNEIVDLKGELHLCVYQKT